MKDEKTRWLTFLKVVLLFSGNRVELTFAKTSGTVTREKKSAQESVIYHGAGRRAKVRLVDWQVNQVNIVVKCFNRFPVLKL